MLKAQNKERAAAAADNEENERFGGERIQRRWDEDADKSNNPLCETENSGWFFKRWTVERWNENTFLLTRKDERFLYSSSSSLVVETDVNRDFDALEKFSSRKGGEKGERTQ